MLLGTGLVLLLLSKHRLVDLGSFESRLSRLVDLGIFESRLTRFKVIVRRFLRFEQFGQCSF